MHWPTSLVSCEQRTLIKDPRDSSGRVALTKLLSPLLDCSSVHTGKNNRFPFLDILGYLNNTHKNPKFRRVRQVPIRNLGWEFRGWDLSHFAKFGIFMGIL